MYRKKIRLVATCAVLILIGLVAILFLYPSSPPFTVRHFKGNVFAVTNNLSAQCSFVPFEIIVFEGKDWVQFCHIPQKMSHMTTQLDPNTGMLYTLEDTSLPVGRTYRIKVSVNWELEGLKSVPRRFEAHRLGANIPVNPFDKNNHFFGTPIVVVSDEWVEEGK